MLGAKILIRRATADDAGMIARAVAMAIGDEQTLRRYCGEEYLSVLSRPMPGINFEIFIGITPKW